MKFADKVKALEKDVESLKARLSMLEARPVLGIVYGPKPLDSHPNYTPIYDDPQRPGTVAPWRNLPEITCFAGLSEERSPR